MSSMITRETVHDELVKLAGTYKAREVPAVMKLVETWARTVVAPTQGFFDDPYAHLKPGDTDTAEGVRRCATCGKVKRLDKDFDYDYSDPNKKRRHCNVCSPEKRKITEYWCPRCKERKPLKFYGKAKQKTPRFTYICLVCEAKYPSIKDGDNSPDRKTRKRGKVAALLPHTRMRLCHLQHQRRMDRHLRYPFRFMERLHR